MSKRELYKVNSSKDESGLSLSASRLSVLDNGMDSLLRQAEEMAGCIRYIAPDGRPERHFDQFLGDLREIREKGFQNYTPDANLESAQALLLVFLRQLHEIGEGFNERWRTLITWYIDEVLKVKAPRVRPDSTWLTFIKNIPDDVFIPRGTAFTFDQANEQDRILYRLADDMVVSGIGVEKLCTLNFESHRNVSPAKELGFSTSLQVKDVLAGSREGKMLFETEQDVSFVQALGLQVSSPALLFREGKRIVTLFLEFEKITVSFAQKRSLVLIRQKIGGEKLHSAGISRKSASEMLFLNLMNNIFFLEMSTEEGWSPVPKYALKRDGENGKNRVVLKFELPGAFPATVACEEAIHLIGTSFPALRILLNRDAWLFPYAWLKNMMISKVAISTEVDNISNILFYNDLGYIDTAAPFAPFGINTERRTYFVLGNYEMAVKQLAGMDLHLHWQQLPDGEGGLADHYKAYTNEAIDNTSFRLSSHFLNNYTWEPTRKQPVHYLFSTLAKDEDGNPLPKSKLSDETVLKDILLYDMKPVTVSEEQYEYTVRAKNGFVRFVLESPAIGFGEKRYRQLFQDTIFEKALKKKNVQVPNPPVTPLIERITVSYRSYDEICLLDRSVNENHRVHHIYPFGNKQIYPNPGQKPLPFIFSMSEDANLLFGLKNVKGDEIVDLFIDFFPQKKEIQHDQFPVVLWYWGNGYQWKRLPDDALLKDTTNNLVMSGLIKIYIPEMQDDIRDEKGLVWLCAGVVKNETSISSVKSIYTNSGRVFRDVAQVDVNRTSDFEINMVNESVAGIAEIRQIAPFSKGVEKEDEEAKRIRVSNYVSHRGRAVTARDYERLAMQYFPEIQKIKCLPFDCKKNRNREALVSLVVIPCVSSDEEALRPKAGAELLLDVESFFSTRIPERVSVDAINPVYEEILVRCSVRYLQVPHNRARVRSQIVQVMNQMIAPWQQNGNSPDFDCSFRIRELIGQIEKVKLVEKVEEISVVQLTPEENGQFLIREYGGDGNVEEVIRPVKPHGIMIPAEEHTIKNVLDRFGIEEMKINENFVVWPKETARR